MEPEIYVKTKTGDIAQVTREEAEKAYDVMAAYQCRKCDFTSDFLGEAIEHRNFQGRYRGKYTHEIAVRTGAIFLPE